MMTVEKRAVSGRYFYGNEVSDYGRKHGYVDYGTLAKAFQKVLNNDVFNAVYAHGIGEWDLVNGNDDEAEIFQFFIIDDQGAEILKEWTDEIVYHNDVLDIYLWGVTHFGTSWAYVLTDIECGSEGSD